MVPAMTLTVLSIDVATRFPRVVPVIRRVRTRRYCASGMPPVRVKSGRGLRGLARRRGRYSVTVSRHARRAYRPAGGQPVADPDLIMPGLPSDRGVITLREEVEKALTEGVRSASTRLDAERVGQRAYLSAGMTAAAVSTGRLAA